MALKQQKFIQALAKRNLSPITWLAMVRLLDGSTSEKIIKLVPEKYLFENKLNSKGLDVLTGLDQYFSNSSKIKKLEEVLGSNVEEKLTQYIELFPIGNLPSGSRARSPIATVRAKFIRFFNLHTKYNWKLIILATEMYIDQYELTKYDRMRTAAHFIIKKVDGEENSDLAEYCEKIIATVKE